MKFQVKLPKLHPIQEDFVNSLAKRKVVVAGRRGGKTYGVSDLAVEGLLAGKRVLYAAPTQDQTNLFWARIKIWLAPLIEAGILQKNETYRTITWNAQEAILAGIAHDLQWSQIKAKTAWDAETMRGDYGDLLIFEEFASMDETAWTQVGVPMLLDNDGDAVFIGTPKRRNHFHKLYLKALSDESGRWSGWTFTSHDNPHLSREALAEITEDMTEDDYRQEILAEFLEGAGTVFSGVDRVAIHQRGKRGEHKGHEIYFGIDWGNQDDYSVISIVCRDCNKQVAMERFRRLGYKVAKAKVKDLSSHWKPDGIQAERNSMGEPLIEDLGDAGVDIMVGHDHQPGFFTSQQSKAQVIRGLALAIEQGHLELLDSPIQSAELMAYEVTYSKLGKPSYGAPEGLHDDTVMALALAHDAMQGAGFGLYTM